MGENIAGLSDGTHHPTTAAARRAAHSCWNEQKETPSPSAMCSPVEGLLRVGSCISIHSCITRLGSEPAAGRMDPPAIHGLVPAGTRHRRARLGCFATALGHALSAAALLVGARHSGHQDRPFSLVAASPGWKAARARLRLASPAGRAAHAGPLRLAVAGYLLLRLGTGPLLVAGPVYCTPPTARRASALIVGCCDPSRRWRVFSG
jgi:hypothetical protein